MYVERKKFKWILQIIFTKSDQIHFSIYDVDYKMVKFGTSKSDFRRARFGKKTLLAPRDSSFYKECEDLYLINATRFKTEMILGSTQIKNK